MTAPFTDYGDFVTYPQEAWDEMQALYAKLAEAEAKVRESALTELSALGQAAEAYEAQLRAEASTARAVRLALERAADKCWTIKDEFDFRYWGADANAHAVRVNLIGKQQAIRAMANDETVAAIIKEASDG